MTALLVAALLAQFGGVRSIAQFRPLTSSQWTEPSKAAVSASSGCGVSGQPTGSTTRTTDLSGTALKDVENTSRSYILQVGTAYSNATPAPVVFVYHGATGTSGDAVNFGICSGTVPAASAICIFIQGVSFQGSGTPAWDDSEINRTQWWQPFGAVTSRDTLLTLAIMADVKAHYCVDQNRVYAAGFSWGCDMVTSLGSSSGNLFRAISAASCAYAFWTTSDPTTYAGQCIANQSPCKGANLPGHVTPSAQAPAYRFTHDPLGDPSYSLTQMTSTIAMVKAHRGCSLVVSSAGSPCTEYQWCSSRVVECTYSGLGHNPPANWGADTWTWFSAF